MAALKKDFFLSLLAAATFCGCAPIFFSAKPAQPISMTSGGIILSLEMDGYDFPYFLSHHAHTVSFAQIGADGLPDMDHLFLSNYYSGPYVYALNLPQGRYVPVAAAYPFLGAQDAVKFNPDDIADWTTEVKPGELAFMGENSISYEWQDGVVLSTRTLKHVPGLIPFVHKPVILLDSRLPARDVGPVAAASAFRHAAQDLRGTLWLPAVQQELEETGNSPPPLWKDFFHRHLKIPVHAKTFSYYGLLPGWGGPYRIVGGLGWLQKDGRAAITVAYVSPNDPGYEPVPKYLDDMRNAGIAGDDHLVTEIRFLKWKAYSVFYTGYDYPAANLVGSKAKVYRTRTILILAGQGYYLIHYRALKEDFEKYYDLFSRFAWYISLSPPKRG